MTPASKEVRDLVDRTAWYHRIELPGGLITPGRIGPSEAILRALDVIDFRGRTVLDLGCWDGLWAFEAERRGASAVHAIDDVTQRDHLDSRGFTIARELLGSQVVYRPDVSVYDIDRSGLPNADIVLFLGVYYHLKHPLLAFSRLRRVCRENALLMVEGPAFRSLTRSYASFYYGRWHVGDPSNWWVPSRKCLRQMMECSFFRVEEQVLNTPADSSPFVRAGKAAARTLLNRRHPRRYVTKARAVRRADPNYRFPDPDLAEFAE